MSPPGLPRRGEVCFPPPPAGAGQRGGYPSILSRNRQRRLINRAQQIGHLNRS